MANLPRDKKDLVKDLIEKNNIEQALKHIQGLKAEQDAGKSFGHQRGRGGQNWGRGRGNGGTGGGSGARKSYQTQQTVESVDGLVNINITVQQPAAGGRGGRGGRGGGGGRGRGQHQQAYSQPQQSRRNAPPSYDSIDHQSNNFDQQPPSYYNKGQRGNAGHGGGNHGHYNNGNRSQGRRQEKRGSNNNSENNDCCIC